MRTWGCLFAVLVVALACAGSATAAPIIPNEENWYWDWGQRQVRMPNAWEITTGDPHVIVGVVDTGIDPSLPDLQGALVPGWDFVGNDGSPFEDSVGHGTVTATEIVARGNNGVGIAGYCWRCLVMPVRVSDSATEFDPTLTAKGITWAADHGARVISLGFNDEGAYANGDPQIAVAIAYAAQRNVLVIASAGNSGSSNLSYPAADPGAYAVAGTDPLDELYPWSTFGPWVSLAAPGCNLVILPGGSWTPLCGNSTSAPAVAGIAALMLSVNLSLTPTQVISALRRTAVPVLGVGGGRVDAYQALLAVGGKVPPPPRRAPPPPPPPPAPHPPTLWQRPPAGPKMATRVQRGVLLKHRLVTIKVRGGRVAATLQSVKAKSCVVTLMSSSDVWVSSSRRRDAVSVAAKVPAGRYKVDVSCSTPRPSRFTLYLRAVFA